MILRPSRARPAPKTDPIGTTGRALVLVVALAFLLRMWHIAHGLPDFLEEALPFRLAIKMWGSATGRADLNPHDFHYPSLAIYLQFLVQQAGFTLGHVTGRYASTSDWLLSFVTDPSPMVIAGRLLEVAFDLAAVVGAARIGERLRPGAGLIAALLTACSPTLIRTSRTIYTDTVSASLAVWSIERMLAWREQGGADRFAAAAALAGLAAGAKYPAAILLLPLAWVAWRREGARAWRPWLPGVVVAAAAFLITTPYAALDFATFARDVRFERLHAEQGHFGNFARLGLVFHTRNLAQSLGWPGMALLVFSLGTTIPAPRRRDDAVTVWLALALFALPIALAHIAAERYLAPVVPLAAVLAAAAAFDLAERAPASSRRPATALIIAALLLPPLVRGIATAAADEGHTQIAARRWCEAHLGHGQLMVQEKYGVVLPTLAGRIDVMNSSVFGSASARVRRAFEALPTWRVVDLPLAVAGRCVNRVTPAAGGAAVELEIFPHVVDFNRVYYDPRLFSAADFVLTSSAVRGRFADDPARYAAQAELYRRLDRTARVAATFTPRHDDEGPAITIYRIGPAARAALDSARALEPLWWAEQIPDDYRRRASALLEPVADSARATSLRAADGRPAPWVLSLLPIFADHVYGLARPMALELTELERLDRAQAFARATFEMSPDDVEACLTLATCEERLNRWADARAVVERGLAAHPANDAPPGLVAEHAETLARTGDRDGARRELERVISIGPPGSALEVAARKRLGELGR
jgi:tetratricopeptide (TPR) repeat protein